MLWNSNSFNSKIYRNIENVYTYRLYQIQILPNVSLVGQGISFTRQEKSGHRGKTKQSSTCSKKIATKVSIHKTGEKKVKITTVLCSADIWIVISEKYGIILQVAWIAKATVFWHTYCSPNILEYFFISSSKSTKVYFYFLRCKLKPNCD